MTKKFGELLVEKGLVDPEEIRKALGLQSKTPAKIGQILLRKGVLSEEDILKILSEQSGLSVAERLEPQNIDEIRDQIPTRFVSKYRIAPYQLKGNTITAALMDPFQQHPMDELGLMLHGYDVQFVLSRETEIQKIIHSVYENRDTSKTADMDAGDDLSFLESLSENSDSMDLANQAPIIRMVNTILTNAVNDRASDIHIEPMERELVVRYRIDGILHRVMSPPKAVQSGIISRIKIMANLNIAENRLPQDGRIKLRFGGKDVDVRVSSLPTQFGERVVMRLLNQSDATYSIDTIRFPKDTELKFRKLLDYSNGIVLITGPTGSGKTTTLYSALSSLNDEKTNIITVEDPVEYQMSGISQVHARPKIGLTFAEGLRSILRQDPDVIMVGEIRDEETARVATQSALTGHLVFSTLHTNDAPSAVTRMLDMGIEAYLITSTVRGILAQRLVRRLCQSCKKPDHMPAAEFSKLGLKMPGNKPVKIYKAHGCKECMNTGYRGRIGVYELLVMTEQMREKILSSPSDDELRKLAIADGMHTLRQAALFRVLDGDTTLEEALRVT